MIKNENSIPLGQPVRHQMVLVSTQKGNQCKLCLHRKEPCYLHRTRTSLLQYKPLRSRVGSVQSYLYMGHRVLIMVSLLELLRCLLVSYIVKTVYDSHVLKNHSNMITQSSMMVYNYQYKTEMIQNFSRYEHQLHEKNVVFQSIMLKRTNHDCLFMVRHVRTQYEQRAIADQNDISIALIRDKQLVIEKECIRFKKKIGITNISSIKLFQVEIDDYEHTYRDMLIVHLEYVFQQLNIIGRNIEVPHHSWSVMVADETMFYLKHFGKQVSQYHCNNTVHWIKSTFLDLYVEWNQIDQAYQRLLKEWRRWVPVDHFVKVSYFERYQWSWYLTFHWFLLLPWRKSLGIFLLLSRYTLNKQYDCWIRSALDGYLLLS